MKNEIPYETWENTSSVEQEILKEVGTVNKEQRGSCGTCGVKSRGAGLVWKGGTRRRALEECGKDWGKGSE